MSKLIGGGGKTPPPVAPVAAALPPTTDDAQQMARETQDAEDTANRKRGRASTILTSQQGDPSAPTLGAAQALGY